MKKMRLIYLEWEDAASVQHWHSHSDALDWAKNNDTYIKQVGWVLEENDKYIAIAGRQGRQIFESDEREDQNFGLLQKIPKTWIRKRKIIKL